MIAERAEVLGLIRAAIAALDTALTAATIDGLRTDCLYQALRHAKGARRNLLEELGQEHERHACPNCGGNESCSLCDWTGTREGYLAHGLREISYGKGFPAVHATHLLKTREERGHDVRVTNLALAEKQGEEAWTRAGFSRGPVGRVDSKAYGFATVHGHMQPEPMAYDTGAGWGDGKPFTPAPDTFETLRDALERDIPGWGDGLSAGTFLRHVFRGRLRILWGNPDPRDGRWHAPALAARINAWVERNYAAGLTEMDTDGKPYCARCGTGSDGGHRCDRLPSGP